jgi:predicted RNA-binding Zn-ribbon protein involved in translation (DUF1610 family)
MIKWKEGKCINCGSMIGDHKHKTKYTCPSKLN